ncbi:hypothetical protein D3C74_99890 [compost metagenome]
MLNREVFEHYVDRKKILNRFQQFGSGVLIRNEQVSPYTTDIIFALLIEVFYRELRQDDRRTMKDLILIVEEIMGEMGLGSDYEAAERLGESLIAKGTQVREVFSAQYFDPQSKTLETEEFSYVDIDREAMPRTKSELPIYTLTKHAQQLLFLTWEVQEEYSIQIEQMYLLQFIKKGEFKKALSNIDRMLAEIRLFTIKEQEYRKDLERDPVLVLRNEDRHERQVELSSQFRSEVSMFHQIESWLVKVQGGKDAKTLEEIWELEERVRKTIKAHSLFSTVVVQNFEYEIELQKNLIRLFEQRKSLRKDFWQDTILPAGILDESIFSFLLAPLFSPKPAFIYPISWAWQEHTVDEVLMGAEELEDEEIETITASHREVKWHTVVSIWAPVLRQAAHSSTFSISSISNIGDWTIDAVEFWMKFKEQTLSIAPNELSLQAMARIDECARLVYECIMYDPSLGELLLGKQIRVEVAEGEPLQFPFVTISPFMLWIEQGGNDEHY